MTDTQSVTLDRVLDAPIDVVWQMWTDAEHFAAWYGPMGWNMALDKLEAHLAGGAMP